MPMDLNRYPKDWKAIAHFCKSINNWECENCGRPCRRPGESREELSGRIYTEHPDWASDLAKIGRFTLTVAHLDHNPPNCHPDNLRPWCSVCHCRYDIRAAAIARKQALKLEYLGQLKLPVEAE